MSMGHCPLDRFGLAKGTAARIDVMLGATNVRPDALVNFAGALADVWVSSDAMSRRYRSASAIEVTPSMNRYPGFCRPMATSFSPALWLPSGCVQTVCELAMANCIARDICASRCTGAATSGKYGTGVL